MRESVDCLFRFVAALTSTWTAAVAQTWQPIASPATPAAVVLRVVEPGGSVLQVVGDAIVRRTGAREARLDATHGVPHQPRALVPSPGGATFVLADNGVFLTHPDVATIDRCEFGIDDPGAFVGLVCDRIDRIWVATHTRLFVAHPGLGYQHAHGVDEGLPTGPFVGLEMTSDGTLLLRHAGGTHAYRPDPSLPAAPTVEMGPTGPGCTLRFLLPTRGPGVVGHRYRERSHHLLRPADGEVDLRRPGRHELLVHAVDRDLDLSPAKPLTIDLPFPDTFDARHAAAGGALVGILVATWLAHRSWRSGAGLRRATLDAALAIAVALQLAMAMTGVGRTWPFIGFTMYGETYREHDVLFTPVLVAHTATGSRVEHGGTLSFATDGIWRHLASLLFADASGRRRHLDLLPDDVDALELRIRRCRLTAAGPRDVAPFVLAVLPREGR